MMINHHWRELSEDKAMLTRMMASIPKRMKKIIKIEGSQE